MTPENPTMQVPDVVTSRLVQADDAATVLQAVYSAMLARKRAPSVGLSQPMQWAQPLLEVVGDSTRKLRQYTATIMQLRHEAGHTDNRDLAELRRVMYQASLMTDRRDRLRKAVEIYTAQGYDVSGNAKRALLATRQLAAWREQRDAYLKVCAVAAGDKLNWLDRLAAIERFWDAVDDGLDKQLEALKG